MVADDGPQARFRAKSASWCSCINAGNAVYPLAIWQDFAHVQGDSHAAIWGQSSHHGCLLVALGIVYFALALKMLAMFGPRGEVMDEMLPFMQEGL